MDANDSNIWFASASDKTVTLKDPLNRRRATDVAVRVFSMYLNEKKVTYLLWIGYCLIYII